MKAVPPKTTLTVACAIPKKDKMDDIVDKLTQLGVQGIIPMQTARVVALPPEESRKGKLERWQRIARAASQQSRRDHVPVVSQITDIGKVISTPQRFDLKLVLTLEADARNIGNVLAGTLPSAVLLMIGPEGDFTPEEVESARKAGFIPTSLGIHVLRVETAAIAVTSYLSVALGI
jgi:16S rRNA (uracil1498-N3)-methyltransferase